jgi:phospholipid-binding lipoprotein MlaA
LSNALSPPPDREAAVKGFLYAALALFCLTQAGCSAARTQEASLSSAPLPYGEAAAEAESSLDDYDDEEYGKSVRDPFERWNRFWFRFNNALLLKALKPAHGAYARVVPAPIRAGLAHFRHHLAAPVRFANSLLQGKLTQAGVEFGRFFINTVTSLGFADVAALNRPLFPYHPESATFGHTLGVWRLPEGPYLVWPLLGPSTLRETAGLAGDWLMAPQSRFLPWQATMGVSAGLAFNVLEQTYVPYEMLMDIALEPYSAMRYAYLSRLRGWSR